MVNLLSPIYSELLWLQIHGFAPFLHVTLVNGAISWYIWGGASKNLTAKNNQDQAYIAVRETGVCRYNGCPIKGSPQTTQYDSAVVTVAYNSVIYNLSSSRLTTERINTKTENYVAD